VILYRALPNVVTGFRLITVPVVIFLLLDFSLMAAFWIIVAAGLSDGLDGYLAKRMDAVTQLGTYLDPIADKALLISVFCCLAALTLLPAWLVCLFIKRDLLIIGGVMLSKLTDMELTVEPTFYSKLNTFLQIALGMWVLGQAALGLDVPIAAAALIYLTALTTLVSGAIYLARWIAGYGVEAVLDYAEVIGE